MPWAVRHTPSAIVRFPLICSGHRWWQRGLGASLGKTLHSLLATTSHQLFRWRNSLKNLKEPPTCETNPHQPTKGNISFPGTYDSPPWTSPVSRKRKKGSFWHITPRCLLAHRRATPRDFCSVITEEKYLIWKMLDLFLICLWKSD